VLAYLSRRGAAAVRIAVLADRCVAKLPIRANIVGVKLQIAAADVVECNVPPYENELKIELLRPSRA
jgi:pyrimidine operon attenuation protein/uracil phosphoribosyltransferase